MDKRDRVRTLEDPGTPSTPWHPVPGMWDPVQPSQEEGGDGVDPLQWGGVAAPASVYPGRSLRGPGGCPNTPGLSLGQCRGPCWLLTLPCR